MTSFNESIQGISKEFLESTDFDILVLALIILIGITWFVLTRED